MESKPTNYKVEVARLQSSLIDSDREQQLTRSLLFKLNMRYAWELIQRLPKMQELHSIYIRKTVTQQRLVAVKVDIY